MMTERAANMERVLNHRQHDLAVVMENIEDPHNIFAVMRTCDAVGVHDIYVVNTWFRKRKKFGNASSSSASKWLSVHRFDDLESCMEVVKKRYGNLFASYLGEPGCSLYEMDLTKPVALAFGNEYKGITDELLAYCEGTFTIPQVGMVKSLNVSVACAVSLYEAKRQRLQKGYYETPRMPEAERKSILAYWKERDWKK